MDGKNRAASSYLSPGNPPADKEQNDPLAQVFHNACSYNFFAMAELLHRLAKGEKGTPELSLRDDPAQETLRFSADASLAFPCSDISALKRDTSGAFRMTTTFMGLQGSQSPLPGYYLDHLAWKAVHEQSPVGDFLDMFSHRLTQFVWHIWRKYRYHIVFVTAVWMRSRSACTPLSGWATASFAISWRLITAKCWRIPGSWQTRGDPRKLSVAWCPTALICQK